MTAATPKAPRINPERIRHFAAALAANPPQAHRTLLRRWRKGITVPSITVLLDRPDLLEALLKDYVEAHTVGTQTDAEAVQPAPAS